MGAWVSWSSATNLHQPEITAGQPVLSVADMAEDVPELDHQREALEGRVALVDLHVLANAAAGQVVVGR